MQDPLANICNAEELFSTASRLEREASEKFNAAFKLHQVEARKGNPDAQFGLGFCYALGLKKPQKNV